MSKTGTRKANGQGYTYKNGKNYRTVITDKGRTVTASGKTEADSKRAARAKLASLPVVTGSIVVRDGNITMEEFLLPWLDNNHKNNIADTTYRRYRGLATMYIIPALGRMSLQNISKKHIKALMENMIQAGLSPRSAQQARAFLSVVFNYAKELELVLANPVELVKNPTLKPSQRNPLTLEEVQNLIKSVDGTFMAARIQIGVICGLRQGEALGLRWADIDFEKNIINVRMQVQKVGGQRQFVGLKSKSSERPLYVSQATMDILKSHRAMVNAMKLKAGASWVDMDLVFPNCYGNFFETKWDYKNWQRALAEIGLAPRRLHDARHTAGTLIYEATSDIETVRRVLGHSSIALTSSTYVHGTEAPVRNAFEKLDYSLSAL